MTLKSTRERVCVTDGVDENTHAQDTSEPGEEIGRDSAETALDGDPGRARAGLSERVCDEQGRAANGALESAEECVFAGETVTESVKMNAWESEKGSVSIKERVLVVEKEGCATVVMYPERCAAHVFLADGTVVTGDDHGDYQVSCLSCT